MRKSILFPFSFLLFTFSFVAFGDDDATYTIGAPAWPEYTCYSESGKPVVTNHWMRGIYVYSAGAVTNLAVSSEDSNKTATNGYQLVSSEYGYGWERMQFEYYLGDALVPPTNVDWTATYKLFLDEHGGSNVGKDFLFSVNDENSCVYLLNGGTLTFRWVVRADGKLAVRPVTYLVSTSCAGRPRRLFWTGAPYNGPTISLKDKFVQLYGPDDLLKYKTGTTTNLVGGVEMVQTNVVTSGIYIDPSSQVLQSEGELTGQFIIAYFESGDYQKVLSLEVIESSKPVTVTVPGVIGLPLSPTGCGYPKDGLVPVVNTGIGDAGDSFGDFLYQHTSDNAYSPKDNQVYPLRPSVGEPWKASVYWMDKDPMGVQWPFELVQYENDWPERGNIYVRGDDPDDPGAKIYFPSEYTVELEGYQDPYDHAVAVDAQNAFYTKGAALNGGRGWSLLRVTYQDDIWFLPIESVLRTDAEFYTLESADIAVGERFTVRGGTRAGLTPGGLAFVHATDVPPGYIYKPASGTQYDVNLYHETTNATSDATSAAPAEKLSDLPSAIYAVNTGDEDIEVWWSTPLQLEGMPEPIDIPDLPQRYHPVWPGPFEAPTIVIASQQGSAGESIYSRYGAATFERATAQMRLAGRRYFHNGNGTVSFWTRAAERSDAIQGATNAPSCLLQLGKKGSPAMLLRIGRGETLQLVKSDEDKPVIEMPLPKLAKANDWTSITLTVTNGTDFTLYVDGTNHVATGSIKRPADILEERLDQCAMGLTLGTITNVLQWVVGGDEVKAKGEGEGEGGEVQFVAAYNWDDVKTNLEAGVSVQLAQDIEQGDGLKATLSTEGQATLDLNGNTLKASTETGNEYRMFYVCPKVVLTLEDSAGGGKLDGAGAPAHGGGSCIWLAGNGSAPGSFSALVMNGGTITGFSSNNNDGGAIYVNDGGAFTMNGGTIENCKAGKKEGGAVYVNNGQFTMNGGTIKKCSANFGGGAYVYNNGTFTMNDGTIENCSAAYGGGVCVDRCRQFTMNGGEIVGCSADGDGGAVALWDTGSCVMNGGLIHENTARWGGGINFDNFTSFTMNGGVVRNNTGRWAFGGIGAVSSESFFTMNGGTVCGNTSPQNPCIGVYAGTVTLMGGLLDIPPTRENICQDASAKFTEPLYFGPSEQGLYLIGLGAAPGRQVAEICLYSHAMTPDEVVSSLYAGQDGTATDLTGYYSFREGEDLASTIQSSRQVDVRTFKDRIHGFDCLANNTALALPGPPGRGDGILASDLEPNVYYQNDATQPGFNPNEEHAFLEARDVGHYTVWALRADLNTDDPLTSSRPGVFVEYAENGEAKLQFYHVTVTNAIPFTGPKWDWVEGRELAGTAKVASVLPGPHPIDTMGNDPWLAEDYWDVGAGGSRGPAYRDREGQIWARCAGRLPIHMYYRMRDGFFFPQYAADQQPAEGTPIPWLSLFGVTDAQARKDPANQPPATWTWTTVWPGSIGTMKIGQTLYEATDGLPGVYNMKSLAVIYPDPTMDETGQTVLLSDPTVKQAMPFDCNLLPNLGLSTDPNGGLVLRQGVYYFTGLPPYLSSRVYLDTSNDELCFIGVYDKKTAGVSILYPNVLTAEEQRQLLDLVPEAQRDASSEAYAAWCQAVKGLATSPIVPNTTAYDKSSHDGAELKTAYRPRDSYALTAVGMTNWVVLIENDATNQDMGVSSGLPINMYAFYVTNEYYTGSVVTREDENNLLSQQLSVLYTETFAGLQGKFNFQWRYAKPSSDGQVPTDFDGEYSRSNRIGTHFTTGQQGDALANMVDQYWACRYRAQSGTAAAKIMGDQWSDWCGPALAEGWVQRVLNNVTPFNQLITDLYDNPAETTVSMIAKAGAPYEGDVALNQDSLTECGLIQLYETLQNAAEKISVMQGTDDSGANEQLMLCAERLNDLYALLGDEAYTDAKDPTILYGSSLLAEYGAQTTSLYCFDNQVASLLDEELALLRGRTGESAPDTTASPYYNRLLWNYTKGVTEGEVAYAVNYGISDTSAQDGADDSPWINEEDAAALYPQGHGDAYGHYLSALSSWYRLLRNPYFSWVCAQSAMTLADATVNVDYFEERKFVVSALKTARCVSDVVELTGLKAWGDSDCAFAGYCDSVTNRAFGYAEWANRGAYGALVNWGVGNSLLPAAKSGGTNFTDQALKKIDRSSVGELSEICSVAAGIQSAEDRIDAGLNPLGLDDNAIPFDLAPSGLADGTDTHYEQIRARAETAMSNANTLLAKAEENATRLRLLREMGIELENDITEAELSYDQELIGYYGRPYSDDVGPGKTYAQGYDGPDLIHYMWMDLDQYLAADMPDTFSATAYHFSALPTSTLSYFSSGGVAGTLYGLNEGIKSGDFWFSTSSTGIAMKPDDITGVRPAQGTIQDRYGEFLSAYSSMKLAQDNYTYRQNVFERMAALCTLVSVKNLAAYLNATLANTWEAVTEIVEIRAKRALAATEARKEKTDARQEAVQEASADARGVGMTIVTDPDSMVSKAEAPAAVAENDRLVIKIEREEKEAAGSYFDVLVKAVAEESKETFEYSKDDQEQVEKIIEAAQQVNEAYESFEDAYKVTVQAIERCKSEVDAAELVQDRRELDRRLWVNKFERERYADMFFRLMRNTALTRYTAAFDLAQKYVYETAKAYDYETAQLSADKSAATDLYRKIVLARNLGDLGEVLRQMDANWLVLKPRLGINNPQPYATWFSLRGECFRILPGEEGDAAWAKELTKYWTDDILSNGDFRRYCQRFQSTLGLKEKEPGLVIPFRTTIDFAYNLFGQTVAGGDHTYDSTWYSTKIFAAGVWFDGYNAKVPGYKGKVQLVNTPVAYLVPMGTDCMRVPGLDDGEAIGFNVVDQVMPAPYVIGSEYLNALRWYPTASDGDLGGADSESRIRRHPSFRAYFDTEGGEPTDDQLDCTRLLGRSVWNTKWMLVIPAGAMNADRDKALSIFINGSDENRDGKLDLLPVSDIRIGFKTYSNSGN